jgi:hypothetical protein
VYAFAKFVQKFPWKPLFMKESSNVIIHSLKDEITSAGV